MGDDYYAGIATLAKNLEGFEAAKRKAAAEARSKPAWHFNCGSAEQEKTAKARDREAARFNTLAKRAREGIFAYYPDHPGQIERLKHSALFAQAQKLGRLQLLDPDTNEPVE